MSKTTMTRTINLLTENDVEDADADFNNLVGRCRTCMEDLLSDRPIDDFAEIAFAVERTVKDFRRKVIKLLAKQER